LFRRVADYRHHLPVAARGRCFDQRGEQGTTDAAAMALGRDVDRILDRPAIGRPHAKGAGIGIAGELAAEFGHQKRIALAS